MTMKSIIGEQIASNILNSPSNPTLLLTSLGITGVISTVKSFLKIEFLGFSTGILFFLIVLVIFDFITGLKAARYNKETLTSRKGLRSVDKLISYFMFICFTALMQSLLQDENYDWSIWLISNFKIMVFVFIFLWEFHSIGENLEKRYGTKPKLFKIIDMISIILERKVIEKIEGVGIMNEIKEEENEEIMNENEIIDDIINDIT